MSGPVASLGMGHWGTCLLEFANACKFCRPNARWLSLLDDFVTTNFGTRAPRARAPHGAKFWRCHCVGRPNEVRFANPRCLMLLSSDTYRRCWERWSRRIQCRRWASQTLSRRRQPPRWADLAWWCTAPCRCHPCGRRSRRDRTPTVVAWVPAASAARSHTRGRWRLCAAWRRARSSRSRRGCSLGDDRSPIPRPQSTHRSTTDSRTTLSHGVPDDRRRDSELF